MELARVAKDDQSKAALLHMAQVWFRLANKQTENRKRKPIELSVFSVSTLRQFSPNLCHFCQHSSVALELGSIR
jgi:hypothetical protein